MKTKLTYLLTCLIVLLFSYEGFSQKRIVVYVQNGSSTATVQWSQMTHLAYAFFNPQVGNTTGNITDAAGVPIPGAYQSPGNSIWFTTANFTTMIAAAKAANPNIKILISAGGAPAGDPTLTTRFNTLLASAVTRAELVLDYGAFIQQYNLDGFDFDLEHPTTAAEKNNHQTFLAEMKTRLNGLEATMCKELELSIALNGETDHFVVTPTGSDYVNPGVNASVDYYHLMTYDASYTNHNTVNSAWPLNHAPLIHAQEAVRDFSSPPFNWPKSKMVVGIPFYGKTGVNGGGGTSLYGSGINATNSAAIFNNVSDVSGGYNYNACPTIINKANFVQSEGLAGVLVWEGSQDRLGANSLLSCIYTAMGGASNKIIETACCAQPALGNDKVLCNTAFPITLNSSTATAGVGVNYTWTKLPATAISSGATLNTQTITAVDGAGTYVVERIETSAGRTCRKSDTITIVATLPTPNLGLDRTLCGSSYTLTPSNLTAFPATTTWQWQFNGSNISGATTTSYHGSTPGTYTLVASLSGCTNTSDGVVVSASTVTPVDACRTTAGTLVLSVTGGVGPFNWYNQDAPGGTILAGGANTSTFTTPVLPLPSVTDYFVEDIGSASNYAIGEPTAGWPTGLAQTANPLTFTSGISMEFDVTSPIKIRSVQVWGWEFGTYPSTFNVVIYNDNNNVVYTSPNIVWAAWPGNVWTTLNLDASLAIGKYRIQAVPVSGGAPVLFHENTASTTFPYTGGANKITITRERGVVDYGPFYNWQISDFGTCSRVRVRATVAASCPTLLPVGMLYFDAEKSDNDVLLTWATGSENGNDYFSIDRSFDGVNFIPVGQVNGNGYSVENKEYYFLDINTPKQTLYYRLAQYDFDGKVSYSSIQRVDGNSIMEIKVAPNPFTNYTSVVVTGIQSSVRIRVFDIQGKLMDSFNTEVNQEILIGESLSSGLYIVEIASGQSVQQFKILKE